jgi:uncharacterized SAM-binding protein YcdF (DUF218 family)
MTIDGRAVCIAAARIAGTRGSGARATSRAGPLVRVRSRSSSTTTTTAAAELVVVIGGRTRRGENNEEKNECLDHVVASNKAKKGGRALLQRVAERQR